MKVGRRVTDLRREPLDEHGSQPSMCGHFTPQPAKAAQDSPAPGQPTQEDAIQTLLFFTVS